MLSLFQVPPHFGHVRDTDIVLPIPIEVHHPVGIVVHPTTGYAEAVLAGSLVEESDGAYDGLELELNLFARFAADDVFLEADDLGVTSLSEAGGWRTVHA
jgi:hypothetical protein